MNVSFNVTFYMDLIGLRDAFAICAEVAYGTSPALRSIRDRATG